MSVPDADSDTVILTPTGTPVTSAQNGSDVVKQFVERMPAWVILYAVIFFPTLTAGYYMAQGAGMIPDLHRQIFEEAKAQSLALQNSQESTKKQIAALTKLARAMCLRAAQNQAERVSCMEE